MPTLRAVNAQFFHTAAEHYRRNWLEDHDESWWIYAHDFEDQAAVEAGLEARQREHENTRFLEALIESLRPIVSSLAPPWAEDDERVPLKISPIAAAHQIHAPPAVAIS